MLVYTDAATLETPEVRMRFGSFIFPVSHEPDKDSAIIDSTLGEIELQDSLGFEAAWLTEHHFDGACAYVDPVVFGAAVASRDPQHKDRLRGR